MKCQQLKSQLQIMNERFAFRRGLLEEFKQNLDHTYLQKKRILVERQKDLLMSASKISYSSNSLSSVVNRNRVGGIKRKMKSIENPIKCQTNLTPSIENENKNDEVVKKPLQQDQSVNNQFKCTKCAKSFRWECRLVTHMLTHNRPPKKKMGPFTCEHCGYSDKYRCKYVRHMMVHIKPKEKYKEWKKSMEAERLRQYLDRKNLPEKPFQCNKCKGAFKYQNELDRHMSVHSEKKEKQREKDNEWKKDLIKHPGEKPFGCPHCDYRSKNAWPVKKHLIIHSTEIPHKCDECEFSCKNPSGLKRHKRLRHSDEKPFKCSYCDFKSKLKENLRRHERQHTGVNLHKCSICGYECNSKSRLNEHIWTHTGENPFKCSECDYECKSKKYLADHTRKHTGEKPFKCDSCSFSCRLRNSLYLHVSEEHTGERRFKCSLCDYSCNLKTNLAKHTFQHTGEKPHKCTKCDSAFTSNRSLKIHTNKHNNEKPEF